MIDAPEHHVGMATYALLSDIENWTDLAREKEWQKFLVKDLPVLFDALDKLLQQTQAMLKEGPHHEH